MEQLQEFLQNIATSTNLPLGLVQQIALAILVIILMPIANFIFTKIVIGWLENLAKNTEGDLDDRLIGVLKKPISWLSLIFTLWLLVLIFQNYFTPAGTQIAANIFNLVALVVVGVIIWEAAPILGQLLKQFTAQTETELDDLLVPYMPLVFKTLAVIVILSKVAEIFFGASSGTLFGIFGGASLALSLLLKDIVYDWFCAVIIYTGGLYKKGDYIGFPGLNNGGYGYGMIAEINLRTTTIYAMPGGTIFKIPNSRMVAGYVENWSQNIGDIEDYKNWYLEGESTLEWGIEVTVEIDGISADRSTKIYDALQEMVHNDVKGISKKNTVRLT
ncbi:MAG: mechanosensitive ion channel family protein, partial [Okeania sp. SIO2H7]|nr:mechanosensitive ion channel family protein [Okeania sp. SIO2H7]